MQPLTASEKEPAPPEVRRTKRRGLLTLLLLRRLGSLEDWALSITKEAATVLLTLASLLCGFSFAGLVLYFGVPHPSMLHVVAACLLAGSFLAFVWNVLTSGALLLAVLIRRLDETSWGLREAAISLAAGLLLLLASLCVMAFAWSRVAGWVITGLVVAFAVGSLIDGLVRTRG